MGLTMEIDMLLIEEIKKHELLYNLNSTDYKNRLKKDRVWEKIANKFGLKAHNCQKRWKSMRDTYKKHKAKRQRNPEEYEQKKPWSYFECLTFLDNVQSTRRSFGSEKRNESKVNIPHEEDTTLDCLQNLSNSFTIEEPVLYLTSPPIQRSRESSSDSIEELPQHFEEIFNKSPLSVSGLDEQEFVKDNKRKNCTAQIFEVLATKVTSSNLTPTQINDIESSVVAFVYQKLAEVQRYSHPNQ